MTKKDQWVGAVAISMLLAAAFVAHARGVSDEDFVREATIANTFEIASSELALDKAQKDDVKKFARQMIDEHTETGVTFKKVLAESKTDIDPPKELDVEHRKLMTELSALSGEQFDRTYLSIQTNAHKDAVKLFRNYSKNGEDETLKKFAADTLPALNGHLEHVKELKAAK